MTAHVTGQPGQGDVTNAYDSILIVGFGGPERAADVLPFLKNVTRGRNVPEERLLEVAEHYNHFGGASPINSHIRDLIEVLNLELARRGIVLPIYWGNRNWHPLLSDTVALMTSRGLKKALAFVLAAYGSYSSCRQYLDDIARARASAGPDAPSVDKIRLFYNHPDFVAANAERVRDALNDFPPESRGRARLLFTAHSIPVTMARNCAYEHQLAEACRLVAAAAEIDKERYELVYQSRSGRPGDPWLEPDILERLRGLGTEGALGVVIHPIGFLSDHMEVLYDLDVEALALCEAVGIKMVRGRTVGTHPRFVGMVGDLISERLEDRAPGDRQASGPDDPSPDACALGCCLVKAQSAESPA
jgi:protoporphyrin/coproporphyrin ferrochelatase